MADLHPVGEFEATVLNNAWAKSKNETSEQFVVKFRTVHGTIFGYFSASNKAIEHTIKKIRAMGYQGDSLKDLNNDELRGNRCNITVNHEDYQGKMQAKVGWVNPYGSEGAELRRDAQVAANVRRYDALLKKTPTITPTLDEDIDPKDDGDGTAELPPVDDTEEAPFH